MKFLVTCLYILIVNLSLLVTFLCCQGSENYNDTVSVFLQKLDTLGGDKLQRIETALNSTIKDVRKILVEGDEVQRKSMTYDLTCALIELWVEITERTSSLERYKNEVLIPNYIANRFLCAWTLMLRVLDVTSENEHLHFLSSRKKIFRLADTATKRNSTPLTKNRRLSKDEFIAVVQMLAPKLDHTIIQKVADHAVADYTFRGKRKNYYEKVLTYFTAWKTYLDYGRAERLRHKLMIELKLHYNDEELGAEIFALTISRDHFIANHVLQYFWEKFAIMMAKGIAGNFEDVLDSEYIGGWYYVEESLKLFQILVRAIKQIEPGRRNFATEYQPLLKRPEVGIPQSSACRAAIPMRNTSTSLSPK